MKFSIITPTYNRAKTLERSIKSILKQSYTNFEMIIIDDGSTDNTKDIVRPYLSDPRIIYIPGNQNGGVNIARNIGIKHIASDSDWITFLDSDDEFLPDALEKMKNIIELNTKYDYFAFSVIYENGDASCHAEDDNLVLDYESTIRGEKVSGEWVRTLHRKNINNGFSFNESINAFEALTWFELTKTEKCLYSREVVRLYYRDVESITKPSVISKKNYENRIKGFLLYLEYFGNDFLKYNKALYLDTLYNLAYLNVKIGNYKNAIKYIYKAMTIDPLSSLLFKKIFRKVNNKAN